MIIKLATNGYIADDEQGGVYVFKDNEKYALHQEILSELDDALMQHVEVIVEVKITPVSHEATDR